MTGLRIAIHSDLRERGDQAAVYRETLELFTRAEQLGFDTAWVRSYHSATTGRPSSRPAQIAERLTRMRELAAEEGRTLAFGIRLHVLSRDTGAAAWAEANRLLDRVSPERVRQAQQVFAGTESVGQQRMAALHNGDRSRLEVSPNLWAGYGLVRGGAGTALVGSHGEVADRIEEYHALGIDHFILSGQPHLEEAYYFAEGAAAELRRRGLLQALA